MSLSGEDQVKEQVRRLLKEHGAGSKGIDLYLEAIDDAGDGYDKYVGLSGDVLYADYQTFMDYGGREYLMPGEE